MMIPAAEIKGYSKLSPASKEAFNKTYEAHYKVLGNSEQERLTPVSIKAEKGYIKVTFNTGDWWHYANGTWY